MSNEIEFKLNPSTGLPHTLEINIPPAHETIMVNMFLVGDVGVRFSKLPPFFGQHVEEWTLVGEKNNVGFKLIEIPDKPDAEKYELIITCTNDKVTHTIYMPREKAGQFSQLLNRVISELQTRYYQPPAYGPAGGASGLGAPF